MTHAEKAWDNWLAQFKGSPRLEAVVKGLYQGADSAAKTVAELHIDRWLDTAVGKQLDGIGEIVGQPRMLLSGSVPFFGFEGQTNSAGFGKARLRRDAEGEAAIMSALLDGEYRNAIRWKIAVNRGHGTAKDIADALNAIFNTTGTKVVNLGNAGLKVIVDITIDPGNPLIQNIEQWIPAAAGVGVEFAGFRQVYSIITQDGDPIITQGGEPLPAQIYDEGIE